MILKNVTIKEHWLLYPNTKHKTGRHCTVHSGNISHLTAMRSIMGLLGSGWFQRISFPFCIYQGLFAKKSLIGHRSLFICAFRCSSSPTDLIWFNIILTIGCPFRSTRTSSNPEIVDARFFHHINNLSFKNMCKTRCIWTPIFTQL